MNIRSIVGLVFAGIIGIVLLSTMFGSFYRVDEGERAVLLTNGRFSEVAEPGLHFKVPFFQTTKTISVRTESRVYTEMASYSYDQQPAVLKISVNYLADPGNVETVYRRYGSLEAAVSKVLDPKVYTGVKNSFGQYTAQRAIQERTQLNIDLQNAVLAELTDTGLTVQSVQVENIDYSDAYEAAIEAVAKAKADVERSKSELLRVEQEQQQKVKQAEAEATAIKLRADADAYQTSVSGKATADAIRERGTALRENPNLVSLVAAEKWDGKLPTSMIPNGSVPFLNVGSSAPTIDTASVTK